MSPASVCLLMVAVAPKAVEAVAATLRYGDISGVINPTNLSSLNGAGFLAMMRTRSGYLAVVIQSA